MPREIKQTLRSLLSQGKTKKTIDALLSVTRPVDDDLHAEVVLQSARFEKFRESRRKGTLSSEDQDITLARINEALLQIIDALPANAGARHPDKRSLWPYLLAAAVTVGLLGSLAEIFDFIDILPNGSSPAASNTVTVLVHGKNGRDHCVLPGRGIVTLAYGDAIVKKPVNNECEVTFRQISDSFFDAPQGVEIWFEDPEGEPYRAAFPDSSYALKRGQYVPLEVMLLGMGAINGIVKDFKSGSPLAGVRIRVKGEEALTNEFGEFTMEIPEEKQEQFVTIRAYKAVYADFEMSRVPTTTDREISILLKPD